MGTFDEKEHRRAQKLLDSIHKAHLKIREGNPSRAKSRRDRRRNSPHIVASMHGPILATAGSINMGDYVRREMVKQAEAEAMTGVPIVHVKNGKPLTAYGAKLLGVPWEGR